METIEQFDGKTYLVKDTTINIDNVSSCALCAFRDDGAGYTANLCLPSLRIDGRDVYFVLKE